MSPSASSLTMKPKPRVASNHLTVPLSWMSALFGRLPGAAHRGSRRSSQAPRQTLPDATSFTPDPPRSGGKTIMVSIFGNHKCSDAVRFRDFTGPGGDDAAGEIAAGWPARSIAASAFSRAGRSASRGRERPDPAPLGEAQRRLPGAVGGDAPARRPHPPRRCRRRAAPRRRGARHSRAGRARRRGPRRRRGRRHSRGAAMRSTSASSGGSPAPPSRARAACARDRPRASRGWSHSGRHRKARPARAPASSSGGLTLLLRVVASPPCLCHSRAGL